MSARDRTRGSEGCPPPDQREHIELPVDLRGYRGGDSGGHSRSGSGSAYPRTQGTGRGNRGHCDPRVRSLSRTVPGALYADRYSPTHRSTLVRAGSEPVTRPELSISTREIPRMRTPLTGSNVRTPFLVWRNLWKDSGSNLLCPEGPDCSCRSPVLLNFSERLVGTAPLQ